MNNTKFLISATILGISNPNYKSVPIIGYLKNIYDYKKKRLDRKIMIDILKVMKKKYYPIFKQIAFMSQKIQAETKFNQEQVTNLIIGSGKPTNIILKKTNQQIFLEHKVTKQQFEQSLEYYKPNDIQINLMISQLQLEMNLALKGKLKNYSTQLPVWLDQDKTLTIFIRIIKIQLRSHISVYKQNLNNQIGSQQNEIEQQINEPSQIDKLIIQQGLDFSDENGAKILHSAVQKYYNYNKNFKQKILKYKNRFEQVIKKIENVKIIVKPGQKPDISLLDNLQQLISNIEI